MRKAVEMRTVGRVHGDGAVVIFSSSRGYIHFVLNSPS